MRDLIEIGWSCIDKLQDMGIEPGEVRNWKVNTRAQHRWGLCRKLPDNTYEIEISSRLLDESVDIEGLETTVIHELLHTIKGCMKHTGKWKELAEKVSWKLGYNIKRCTSAEEKGIEQPVRLEKPRLASKLYEIKCVDCGHSYTREKLTKTIQHPELYRCKCGGKLIRVN